MLTRIRLISLVSDQLYTWSDENTRGTRCCSAKTSQRARASTAPAQVDSEGLPHRAIQTVRQAGMQVRRWPWTWAQVLPVGELSWSKAANGLRAPGSLRANIGVSRQLSPKPRDSGDDLRDQSRTSAPSRGALKGCHERVACRRPRPDRCGVGRCASRQYARRLAGRRRGEFVLCGGSR